MLSLFIALISSLLFAQNNAVASRFAKGDYLGAEQACEKLKGEKRTSSFLQLAGLFRNEGLFEKAASCYEKAGDAETARSCNLDLGDKYLSFDASKPFTVMDRSSGAGIPNCVALSRDGRFLLSGETGAMTLWELSTGKALKTIKAHKGEVEAVALGPDASRALSCGEDKTIKNWDLAAGKAAVAKDVPVYINSVSLDSDGKYAASGSYNAAIALWDASSGQGSEENRNPWRRHRGDVVQPGRPLLASSDKAGPFACGRSRAARKRGPSR
jgi:tetratricopeptide (TPR) repeat protein